MWHIQDGERVLRGAQWDLFREGMDVLWDRIEMAAELLDEDDGGETGVAVFDSLRHGQQLALLALVGKALSDEAVPAPDLDAHTEGTVGAVYDFIYRQIEAEVDTEGEVDDVKSARRWRRLVGAACRAVGEPSFKAPRVSSADLDDWWYVVDDLANEILWEDRDFDLAGKFLDADPAVTRPLMSQVGIPDDYFAVIAPDPTEEQLEAIRATLRRLCGRPEPVEEEMYDGLAEDYHGLHVGPCDRETIEREAFHRLIFEIATPGLDGFDCSYAEWADHFREGFRRAIAEGWPDALERSVSLTPRQEADTNQAERAGMPLMLDNGYWIEPRAGRWVVVSRDGSVLYDVLENMWGPDADDPGDAIRFATAREALLAYLRSDAIAADRAARYQAALRILGREEEQVASS